MNNDFECCNNSCPTNYEKALETIANAAKFKPACCQIVNNGIALNNFLSANVSNTTITGSGNVIFENEISKNGSLISFTAPSATILLEEKHTYLITVSVNGTTGAAEDLSMTATINGSSLSAPLLSSGVIAGFNSMSASFFVTTTDDSVLNITNLNTLDITDANVSINILVIA